MQMSELRQDVVQVEPSWPDLVFHVLAHVPVEPSVPAGLFDPDYVAFAASHLGAASQRELGQDVTVLGRVLSDHARLARVQALALLFRDLGSPEALGARPLAALRPAEVLSSRALGALARDPDGAELLWTSALLELPAYRQLPVGCFARQPLARALARVAIAAPHLKACEIRHARALGKRGRVVDEVVWLGLPVDPEHCAWQAAHEATVAEVSASAGSQEPLTERDVEAVAVVLLAERSRRFGLASAHARFCETWGILPMHTRPEHLCGVQWTHYNALRRRESCGVEGQARWRRSHE